MNNKNYSLEVLVNGRPVTEYHKEDKVFIEGRQGTEYSIRFRNNSHKKVMGIFSVDGIEVLEGKEAVEGSIGYIIDPFSNLEVKGFRIDDSSVAAFKFAETEKSYSNTMGAAVTNPVTKETTYEKTTKNNGTIGVRVFEENVPDNDYSIYYSDKSKPEVFYGLNSAYSLSSGSALTFNNNSKDYLISGCLNPTHYTSQTVFTTGCNYIHRQSVNQFGDLCCIDSIQIGSCVQSFSAGGMVGSSISNSLMGLTQPGEYIVPKNKIVDFDIGTALGNKLVDKVKEVKFNRSKEFTQLEIFYASRKSLVEFGIDFSNTKKITQWPQAFEEKKKFCKMPAGY